LYQINDISNIEIDDKYEPLEEGLDVLTFTRNAPMFSIKLTKDKPNNEKNEKPVVF
jgi:hypothetical protein